MQEILKAENINKYFHEPLDFHVLKNISLLVNKGEFVTIVGKSGSGKSTLMYVLASLDTDYTGNIIINNKNMTGLNENKLATFQK